MPGALAANGPGLGMHEFPFPAKGDCEVALHLPAAGDLIPLEILPLGEFDPVYRSTLEVQAGELPVLPLSIYGSVRVSPHKFSRVFLLPLLVRNAGGAGWGAACLALSFRVLKQRSSHCARGWLSHMLTGHAG